MKKSSLLIYVCLLFATTIYGQDAGIKPVNANFIIEGGIEYGGDEILEVYFTNGENQKMRAGQGGYIAFGGQFQFASIENLMLKTTLGFKYNTTAANNADIKLTRLPLNLTAYYLLKNDFRLGLGVTNHQSVKFDGDGFVPNINFDSSLGTKIEFGYKWVSVNYTALKYKFESEKIDASSFGLALTYVIPNKK
ncbi:MAG: hypothetical protein KGZ87_06090 [Bacteroidetes bacterium]|nr:hypothetical protein [Bacteroidota bacterium]